ncbi:hypothetical protein EVAR_47773_1 [Eumeta japonica]|uniref:Uncharacterized protein n=1 Tax=Eumeta variegata TaxID=151549 RepID=A0A4C1XVZ1_EUMVA|nr:hypothetical protein EVAR_47773_1 [Eumeta japonica]
MLRLHGRQAFITWRRGRRAAVVGAAGAARVRHICEGISREIRANESAPVRTSRAANRNKRRRAELTILLK